MLAQDKKGLWYVAKITDIRQKSTREFHVRFRGFGAAHDEWVVKARLRQKWSKAEIVQLNASICYEGNTQGLDTATDTWIVDKIVGKRGSGRNLKFRVCWDRATTPIRGSRAATCQLR